MQNIGLLLADFNGFGSSSELKDLQEKIIREYCGKLGEKDRLRKKLQRNCKEVSINASGAI